jgi:general secretion pathway protein A
VYTEFFGLNEKPFAITPDPRYLYMSARHTDALAHLIYGISESGGFIQLTGEVGTGKTTLIRSLLEQLPAKAEIALILNPQLSRLEFLQVICQELRIPATAEDSVRARIDALNAHLLRAYAEARRTVLIVDEAQALTPELLEQIRLLTNLETPKKKLLQIILIGQPELRDLLDRPEMRQVAQRITGRYHLEPLGKEDTALYVRHRMRVAGAQSDVFTPAANAMLYRRSRGIPRLINVIADRALLAAYTRDQPLVDRRIIVSAAAEVFGTRRASWRWWPAAAVAAALAVFGLATTNLWHTRAQQAPTQPAAALPAPVAAAAGAPAQRSDAPNEIRVAEAAPSAPAREPDAPARELDAPARHPDAPGPITLASLGAEPGLVMDRDQAVAELLALWGGTYERERGDACDQAAREGLQCLVQENGSLGELRRLNWPAIVTLIDENGAAHFVVIASLDQTTAHMLANGKTFDLPLSELTYHWFGEHLLLWRPGIPQPKDLIPGMRDAGVLWLRETLARLGGEDPPANPSPLYDSALETRVREFQRAHMLTVDGIVGARTQVAMIADLNIPGTPLLAAGH